MYEGIAAGALNFDYAPAAMVIAQEGRPKRIWMNTTQDGKSAIDDLREANLINGLKLSTKDYHSVTAFQVSLRGLQLLSQVSKELKANVDAFVFAPKPYRRELLKIRYIPIRDPPDPTSITELEQSELFTQVLKKKNPSLTRKKTYRTFPALSFHNAYVAWRRINNSLQMPIEHWRLQADREWIPFGSNQIVALNERLGSMDRCQGGLFTSLIDVRPTDTQFEVPPGLTEVRILDYDPVRYINFEAEINFPEDDGIVQVENFGIHLNVDGTIFYGIKVDAILDKRADRISVDLLSRLLVDIHQDSSEIMDDLLSSYQTSLLDMVFLEMFLRSFFTRIFVLEELLKHIRELIFRAKEDPHHLVTIRAKLNQATNDLILVCASEEERKLIDKLRDIGLGQYIELPQVAVMGDTSSGKSSLLSALSGVSFPSSDQLTTRCPTQLVLTRADTFRGTVRLVRFQAGSGAQNDEDEGKEDLNRLEDVPDAITKLTKKLIDEGQYISDDQIVIEMSGPELPNLTLTDLPGLVRTVGDHEDQSIIPRVRQMVDRYMQQERTVIIAVVPANVDMHNTEILQAAQEADPNGTRTIAVVTKVDLVDADGKVVLTDAIKAVKAVALATEDREALEMQVALEAYLDVAIPRFVDAIPMRLNDLVL
ncbi:Interferon-induced GTP-binding protein Mx, partial [Phytophthora palmivora]